MKYKKQIVIVCLFTFLMLPFNSVKAYDTRIENKSIGGIVSVGLGVVGGASILPVLCNVAIALGVSYVSVKVIECAKEFITTKGVDYFLSHMGEYVSEGVNKYAISSELVEEFHGYLKEGLYVPDGSYLTTVQGMPLGTFKVPYGSGIGIYYNSTDKLSSSIVHSSFCSVCRSSGYNYIKVEDNNSATANGVNYLVTMYCSDFDIIGYTKSLIVNPSTQYSVLVNYSDVSVSETPFLWEIPFDKIKGDVIVSNPPTDIGDGVALPSEGFWGGVEQGQLTTEGAVIPYPGTDTDTDTDTGVIEKPNTDVGEIPTTGEGLWDSLFGWLGTLFAPLIALLEWIGEMVNGILDSLKNLIMPKEMDSLNFSPLYFSFADKFPFCIPFDLIRMVKEFQAEEEKPIFKVDMSGFSSGKMTKGEVGFTIDLTKFDDLILIVKTLTLVSFIFGIAFKTRDIIKG